jgi:hypothetical protein
MVERLEEFVLIRRQKYFRVYVHQLILSWGVEPIHQLRDVLELSLDVRRPVSR